jgi:AcrR family transcriptional regulator
VTETRHKLPAAERRRAVLDAACSMFSEGSYRGTTTAEIAREAGCSEPILYRHFESKQALYLACLEEAWEDTRAAWEEGIAAEPDPCGWMSVLARAAASTRKGLLADLWIHALTEANDEPAIAAAVSRQLREVHDYVAGIIRRSQAAGGINPDRDADAEAWLSVSMGLLNTIGHRLGGLLSPEDMDRVRASRGAWMSA